MNSSHLFNKFSHDFGQGGNYAETKDENLTLDIATTPATVIFLQSDGWTSFLTGVIFWLAVIVSCSACCRNLCKTMFCDVPQWIKNDLCGICFPAREELPPETRQIIHNIGETEIMLNSVQVDPVHQTPNPPQYNITPNNPPRYDIALSMPKPVKKQQTVGDCNNSTNVHIKYDRTQTQEQPIVIPMNHSCHNNEVNTRMCTANVVPDRQSIPPPTYNEALEIIRQQEEDTNSGANS